MGAFVFGNEKHDWKFEDLLHQISNKALSGPGWLVLEDDQLDNLLQFVLDQALNLCMGPARAKQAKKHELLRQ